MVNIQKIDVPDKLFNKFKLNTDKEIYKIA